MRLVFLVAFTACSYDPVRTGPVGDDGACFGTYAPICLTSPPTAARVFDGNGVIDTDGAGCAETGTTAMGWCVIAATEITIADQVLG